MITTAEMLTMLKRNLWVIDKQADGLTHDDSMLQLPFQGNCFNWVVGHMLVHRDKMLKMLDHEPLWAANSSALYDFGSEPLTDSTLAVPFDKILIDLRTSQDRLAAAFDTTNDAMLNTITDGHESSIRERLTFLVWHDAYHAGQAEYLRQLAGVNDKVI